MAESTRLWTPQFVLLNLQFMLVSAALALFFPFQAYLASRGFSTASAGFIIGADALASLVAQPVAALLIHAGNARRCLAWGAAVLALALWTQGLAQDFWPLVATRLVQGCGFSCVIAALVTLIVQAIPCGMSGQAFGWVSLVRLIPYAAIPSALEWAGFAPAHFDRLLLLGAALALTPLAALAWLPPTPAQPAPAGTAAAPGRHAIGASLRHRSVRLLLLAGLLLYSGYSAAFFYLRSLGEALGLSAGGLFFSVATATMILVRLAGGWVFDRFSKVGLSVAGFVMMAVAYALLPWTPSMAVFLGLAVALGLGWGAVMPLQSALMFDLSPPADRSLNQNLLLVCMQAGFFLGPALGARLWSDAGFSGLFMFAALTSLVAAALTAGVHPMPAQKDSTGASGSR